MSWYLIAGVFVGCFWLWRIAVILDRIEINLAALASKTTPRAVQYVRDHPEKFP